MQHLFAAFVCMAVAAQIETPGAEQPKSADRQQAKWNELYSAQASKYEIRVDGDRENRLELKPEPVLFWSNPIRGGETNGAVFIWTRAGRAETVGTVFSFLDRSDPNQRVIAHSFHSLSLQPLGATRDGRHAWTIAVPGILPQSVPDAPKPAATAPLRLTQMRELARDFTAATVHEGVEQELRLLPQPIYRNTKSSDDVLDGALFTFVTGTDPELMLLIEARETSDGPAWQYAAGRFSDLTIKLRHKQFDLWTHVRGSSAGASNSPYLSGRVEIRPRVIE